MSPALPVMPLGQLAELSPWLSSLLLLLLCPNAKLGFKALS